MLTSSQVINKILQTKNYDLVKKNGFDKNYFKGYENEFDFIDNHFKNFGNIPDVETFINQFPDFDLFEVHESDQYLIDKLYEEDGYNRFAPKIPEIAKLLENDSRDAYEYLMANLNELKPQGMVTGVDIIKNAQERYDKYIERQNTSEKTVIKTGFAELDEIFQGWEFGEELVTIVARINVGKCLEKSTEVLMHDGSRKRVEEIKIGDKVRSQYTSNNVTQLHHGFSKGYKIIPNRGTPFTVSEDHIMTFIRKYHIQVNGEIIPKEELVDMTIEDYLNLSNFYKKQYFLFTPSIEFEENTSSKKNPQTIKFKVETKDQIEYFGFACDGDHRFILGNGVLTHNSWLLMKFLAEAWEQGYRVGSYSGEMNPIKLGYRFDSLFKHYSNRCLTWGGQVDNYQDYINTLKQVNNPFLITTQKELGGKATVPKIRRFAESNELDILGIDQFSLMDDVRSSTRDQNRLKMARISEDLFLLSTELKIPILGLAQANRSALDKDGQDAPGLENIKESDDIGANSSKVIGLRQSAGGHLILDVIKNREGKVGSKLMYSWDIDQGHFAYIPSNDDIISSSIKQPIQQQTAQQLSKSVNPF